MATVELPCLYVDAITAAAATSRAVVTNRDPGPQESGVPLDTTYEDERGRPRYAVQNNGQPLRELG